MSDRWRIEIKDINAEPTVLHAAPNPEFMAKYITEAIDQLRQRCSMAEEQMILGGSSTEVLTRIRDFCDHEIKRRDSLPKAGE